MEEITSYQWYQVISSVMTIVVAVAVTMVSYVQNKHEKAMASIRENTSNLISMQNDHSNKITALETKIKSMPEFKNMEKLSDETHAVARQVAEIRGMLKGISAKLGLLEQHLISNNK